MKEIKIKSILIALMLSVQTVIIAQIPSTNYALSQNWLLNHNLGKRIAIDPSYTIIQPDTNNRTVVGIAYDTLSNYDVFCIYPTIAAGGGLNPKIHPLSFSSAVVTPLVKDLYSQYGRYGRLYAPFYRQVNVATFLTSTVNTQARLLDTALADVTAAFEYYFQNYNGGKKIILVGHSQGSVLLGMMLRKFEANQMQYGTYLSKIALTVLPGFVTGPHTLKTSNTGGWFQNYTVCQNPNDLNCMMTWQTYRDTATLGTPSQSNHIYNDSLVAWNYHYQDFNTTNFQILNDPLYFASSNTISLTIFPNNLLSTPYNSVTTHYIAYQNYFTAYTQQVPTDYGLKVQRIVMPLDYRRNPFTANFFHVYDHYIAAGSVNNIILNKLSIMNSVKNTKISPVNNFIFPNPSSDGYFKIEIEGNGIFEGIEVYNTLGQKVTEGNSTEFYIGDRGIFLVRIKSESGTAWRKIVRN